MLAAHAMGLGACALSLIPAAVNRSGPLNKLFQIPDKNEVLAAMVLGYPKHRFRKQARTARGDLAVMMEGERVSTFDTRLR